MHRMASGYGVGGCGVGAGGAELQPELGLASDGSDSSHEHPASPGSPRDNRKRPRPTMHKDVEMGGSESGMESHGNESQGTESHGNESQGTESHGNESQGTESHGNKSVGSSSNGNSKDSALLESSVSNKSSNSHSPSPLSSSNAFSLVSSEQDNPSSSGCSSEQSAKAKTRKELAKTIKELKKHLPKEKRNKGKPSPLNTLKYALQCVKQVKANEEHYQMLMSNDSHPHGLDVSSYTIEEINRITSEYTLKSTDIFAVAVSLITGKIIYISDQASSILNCKRKVFDNAKFVEFLAPHDVGVFYSFTTPYCLPSWNMCTGAESSPNECMQEKSFFCRISGGKEHEGDLQYYPFRMTPYLMKVQDPQLSQEQLCCLLLAERVHSGYEAAVQKSPVVCLKHSEPPLLAKDSTTASMADLTCKDQTVYSYQQINCLDSVIRYLESYNVPITVKRKCSTSDTDMQESQDPLTLDSQHGLSDMEAPKTPPSGAVAMVESPLTPLPLLSKAESVVSITSQCSYRSTIVHVGDKKPLPESEMIEDVAESPPVVVSSSPNQEKEAYKRLDLTKQVLAAHTQKEEQAFLHSCRDLRSARTFQKDCSTYLHKHRELTRFQESPGVQGSSKPGACSSEPAAKKGSRNRKSKKRRLKQPDSSGSAASDCKPRLPLQGLNQTSWSPSETSQSAFSVSYRAMVPAAYQLPVYPTPPAPPTLAPCPDPSLSTGYGEGQNSHAPPTATPYPTPMVTPVVALVLPNYLFPPIGQLGQMDQMGTAPSPAFFPEQTQTQTAYTTQQPFHTPQPAYTIQTQASFNSQQPFLAQPAYTTPHPFQAPQEAYTTLQPFEASQEAYTTLQPFEAPQAAYTTQQPFQALQAAYTTQQPFAALPSLPVQALFVSQASYPDQPCSYSLTLEPSKSLATEPREGAASRSSTPVSAGHEVPLSPSLFESRCNTLQLNLLSMEEMQRSAERQNNTGPSAGAEDSCPAGAAGQQGRAVVVKTGIQVSGQGEVEHFVKCVPQEPLWLLMANADDKVMMTYEMPSRDIQRVLREDNERLRQMQKSQPRFSSDQHRELMAEHPWVRRGGLPSAINVKECVYCEEAASEPVQEYLPDMDLGDMGGESSQEGQCPQGQTEESPLETDYGS